MGMHVCRNWFGKAGDLHEWDILKLVEENQVEKFQPKPFAAVDAFECDDFTVQSADHAGQALDCKKPQVSAVKDALRSVFPITMHDKFA